MSHKKPPTIFAHKMLAYRIHLFDVLVCDVSLVSERVAFCRVSIVLQQNQDAEYVCIFFLFIIHLFLITFNLRFKYLSFILTSSHIIKNSNSNNKNNIHLKSDIFARVQQCRVDTYHYFDSTFS